MYSVFEVLPLPRIGEIPSNWKEADRYVFKGDFESLEDIKEACFSAKLVQLREGFAIIGVDFGFHFDREPDLRIWARNDSGDSCKTPRFTIRVK
jgi:hypothetical protein